MKICLINLVNSDYVIASLFVRDNRDNNIVYSPPVGLLSLGAVLEKNGHTVEILDLEGLMKQKKLVIDRNFHNNAAKIILNKNIDILGFNTRCDTYPGVLNIAKKCKKLNPSCIIIFGGPQATLLDIETLEKFRFVDIIVRGEGELTIVELMNRLKDKEGLQGVAGITYRGFHGEIIRNPDRKLIENLDTLPQLAYHLIDKYNNNGNMFKNMGFGIEVGRGCPYNCIFCSSRLVHKQMHRMKSPENIIKEIEFLKNIYGIKWFNFLHDHLLFDKEKIMELCDIFVQRKLNVYWGCSSRPEGITPELLKIMVKAGCQAIYFGIESGSQRIQKFIQKNIDVSIVPKIIEECEKYNIEITASFIIGFPDEKIEDINATLNLALRCSLFINCIVQLHLLSPMPRTPLFERYKDRLIFTGLFSDTADPQLSRLKENLSLIKRYPFIFCNYYGFKPKHISINLPYNIVQVFIVILIVFRLSCLMIIKEFKFRPMWLFRRLYKKISKENCRKGCFILTETMKQHFPQIIDYIYTQRRTDPSFIKSIIRSEIKNYDESLIKIYLKKRESVL